MHFFSFLILGIHLTYKFIILYIGIKNNFFGIFFKHRLSSHYFNKLITKPKNSCKNEDYFCDFF